MSFSIGPTTTMYRWQATAFWILVLYAISTLLYFFGSNINSSVFSKGDSHEMHELCDCPRAALTQALRGSTLFLGTDSANSSCSVHATNRGLLQKVVSYSFYGRSTESPYFRGTTPNVGLVAQKYPGWTMRLYHNISVTSNSESKHVLCNLWCNNPHLDLCHVHYLPGDLGNQSEVFGMIWRFFVLGDPLIDRFLIRDLDSLIYQREVDSVQEWINGGRPWHAMRDHPLHSVPMLGGLWGGTNWDMNLSMDLRAALIRQGKKWQHGYDQVLLGALVWPTIEHHTTSHDSYHCQQFAGSQPFPTQRHGNEFVGDAFPWQRTLNTPNHIKPCPVQCRPKTHQNWTYC